MFVIAKLSLNSTQLNSTSTQFEAEVSLNSTFSSHPPTHPPTRKSSLSQMFHASTQLNSTSTQTKAEVSLNSTFSSQRPYLPATQKSSLIQIFHLLLEFHVSTKTCCLRYSNIIPNSCLILISTALN